MTQQPQNLMGVNLIVTHKNKRPAIELRSLTTNPALIKTLLSCAYHGIPVIIMPKFTDALQSLNSCIEKGILIKEGQEYFFTSDFENLTKKKNKGK
jgi:predicted permease